MEVSIDSVCGLSPCVMELCFLGYAVAMWLGIRLQMLGVAMVTGVAFIAVLEHHFNTVNPGAYISVTYLLTQYLFCLLCRFCTVFLSCTVY